MKTDQECKMAASRKRKLCVDYRQLNLFSSAILYDTSIKRSRSKFYAAERIIERRRKSQVNDSFILNIANNLRLCVDTDRRDSHVCEFPGRIKIQYQFSFDKIFQDYEYLIKWQGWPFHSCSWEPSENLNPALLRYE